MLKLFGTKFVAVIALMALVLIGTSARSQAENGRVVIKVVKAGFIVGIGGGGGTLFFHDRSYHLNVGGINVGMIGIAGVKLEGTAYNLHSPADIAGTYGAVGAGVAVLVGGKVVRLQNTNGVVLELHGAQVGLDLSLNLSGMTVSLQ